MQCTKCNSENTQRLQVVYDNGTQNINTISHSAGAGIGGAFGVGGARTSTNGISQSTLAHKASPPAKHSMKWAIISIVIGLFCLGGSTGSVAFGICLIVIGGYFSFTAVQFNSNNWPGLYQFWKESWLCNKCGTIYHQP